MLSSKKAMRFHFTSMWLYRELKTLLGMLQAPDEHSELVSAFSGTVYSTLTKQFTVESYRSKK